MIVQEITKLVGNKVNKLICFATGSIGEIPGRFETIDETKEGKKMEQLFLFVFLKWFVKGSRQNYFLCSNAFKNVSLETADNALLAMKNWKEENLEYIKNATLIIGETKTLRIILNKSIL